MSDSIPLAIIAGQVQAQCHSIMVVDDEAHVLSAIEDALQDEFMVHVETSPQAALERLRQLPDVAVVISDQRMPTMSGDAFLAQVGEQSAATRLMITGFADIEAVMRAVNVGRIFGYLTKPWRVDHLKLTLYKAVEHYTLLRGLAHEQSLLRNLMDNLPDAIYFKDAQRRYLRLNAAQVRRLGAEGIDQVLGRNASEFLSPARAALVERDDDATLVHGEVQVERLERVDAPGGAAEWFATTKAPIRDAMGQITGLVGITRDVSAAKRLEETLREREAALRHAQRLAQVGHFVWNVRSGAFVRWSESAPLIMGDNAVTMPRSAHAWLARVPAADRDRVRHAHGEAITSGRALDLQFPILRGDGSSIVVREYAEPLTGAEGGPDAWFVTVQDMTQLRRAEDELRLVLDIGKAIGSASGVDEALGAVLQTVCRATAWDYGEAWLRDDDSDALICCPQWHGDRVRLREFRVTTEHLRIAVGEGLPGRVWQTGRPEWCPDVSKLSDGRFVRSIAARDAGLKASLAVPIQDRQGKTMIVVNFAMYQVFPQDVRLLELVTGVMSHLSEFLQRKLADVELAARLHQQAAVAELGQLALRASDITSVMQAAADMLKGTLGVHYVGVLEHVPERHILRMQAGCGWSADVVFGQWELPDSSGSLAAASLTAGEAIVVGDLPSDQRFFGSRLLVEHAVISGACMVIAGPERPFGLFGVFSRRSRRYSQGDIRFLTVVANLVSEAFARAEARDRLIEREARFGLLLESTAEPIYGVDLQGLCTFANPACALALGFTSSSELIGLDMHALTHHSRSDGSPYPLDQCPIYAVLVDSEGEHRDGEVFWRADGSRFAVEYWSRPMRNGTQTVGAVIAFQDITQRQAKDRRIARLTRMHAMLSGINTTIVRVSTREELFAQACQLAADKGQFQFVSLRTLDDAGNSLVPAVVIGDQRLALEPLDVQVPETDRSAPSLAYRAFHERRIQVCNDLHRHPVHSDYRTRALALGILSAACVPLLQRGAVVAVLTLSAGETGVFDDEELVLLEEMAADIGFALDTLENRRHLAYLSAFDALTGLANRASFLTQLAHQIAIAHEKHACFAVVMLNLNRFRSINESLGMQTGDDLLRQVARRLQQAEGSVCVARMSGDTFAVMLDDVGNADQAAGGVRRLQQSLASAFELGERELRVSARLGVALYPSDGAVADQLSANAEAALQKARGAGDAIVFYESAFNAQVSQRLDLETRLRQALARDEFVLHYQPKIDLRRRCIVGVEALIRWCSPDLGLVAPGHFIPLMEETGLIMEVGAWALRQAVQDHAAWAAMGCDALRVAVNVSCIQLRADDYVEQVRCALAGGATPPGIDLEITESLVMEDIDSNLVKLRQLRDLGVGLAIDDFGTGYSSLGYLAKLPVQVLKIDRSFIITMLDEPDTMALVSTIISLAHSLRLTVVAEGVDQEDQAKMLRLLRCDQMQGYLFSKPLPFAQITAMLQREEQTQGVPT